MILKRNYITFNINKVCFSSDYRGAFKRLLGFIKDEMEAVRSISMQSHATCNQKSSQKKWALSSPQPGRALTNVSSARNDYL